MSENILEIKDLTKDYGDFVLDKVPSRNMAVLRATSKNSCYLDSRICMYYTVLVTAIRLGWKRR